MSAHPRLLFAICSVLASCSRTPSPSPSRSAEPTLAPSSPPPSSSSPAPPSAASARAAPGEQILRAWSSALDRHDVAALAPLYAPRVRYYGRDLAASAVLASKQKALGPGSDFHQSIVGRVDFAPQGDGRVALTFTKRSVVAGKSSDVAGKLVVKHGAERFEIVEETDDVTEARGQTSAISCEAAAASAAEALPKVKAVTDELVKAAEASGDTAHFGGVGPIEDSEGLSASLGLHTEDRFEARISYSVDRKGVLTVIVDGEPQEVPKAALRDVARACRRGNGPPASP